MFKSPSHAVLGCSELERTASYLAHFDLEAGAVEELSSEAAAALYGVARPLRQQVLRTPGAEQGWLRLVETPEAPPPSGPYDRGPLAIDFYTLDTAASLERVRKAGGGVGSTVTYEVGDLQVQESDTHGPDDLRIVFLQISRRRPSLLDREPERLHSELHSIVWSVDDLDGALAPWVGEMGLSVPADARIEGDTISRLLSLPDSEVPVRFALVADAETRPARLELLEYLEHEGPERPSWPLRPGLHAVGMTVINLEEAMARLASVEFGKVATLADGRQAVTAVVAGGVRIELHDLAPSV